MSVSIGGGGAAAAGLSSQQLMPKEYNDAVEKFRLLQGEMQAAVEKQAQFEAQKNENSLVKAELDGLKEGQSVYKLMGTVLVRQDVTEAKSLVGGRLAFITTELERAEAAIKQSQEKMMAQRRVLQEILQNANKQAAAAAAQQQAAGGK